MLPPISEEMKLPVLPIGGWMYSSLRLLLGTGGIKMAVATVYSGRNLIKRDVDGVTYYLLPLKGRSMTKYNHHLERLWREIKLNEKPDVVHIHGSEYPHGLAYIRGCGNEGVVVSLQGVISVCARYYTSGINSRDVRRYITFRDIVRRDSMLRQQDRMEERGKLEIELLQSVSDVIGRTDWDRSHSVAINPSLRYHHCGETLRRPFYENKWNYASCEPHSIFISQATTPIKGVHILLKALPLILSRYDDTKVYIAGGDPVSVPWYRLSGYGKYLNKMIAIYDLAGKVIFLGSLDEEKMCSRYLMCNVFVSCSSIENSPNSLGEAQMLGVPHVASFVGGVPEIVNYNKSVLYRFEEYEMLADKICDIFEQGPAVQGVAFDRARYDGEINLQQLIETYKLLNPLK